MGWGGGGGGILSNPPFHIHGGPGVVTNRTPAPVKKSAYEPGQGLFQDFASEGANAKFQNSRGGGANTKPRRGNSILKGRKSQFLEGANGSQGGAKAPPGPPP